MLKALLAHTLKAVWHHRITGFWPIWLTITAAAAASVAWAVGRAATPIVETEGVSPDFRETRRHVWSRGTVAALLALGIFLGCYIAMILVWEDFTYYDNDTFTLFTLRGHDFIMMIWPGAGRFLPLGLQEYNLIRHFTRTVAGYHALSIAQLLILSYILLVLDDRLSLVARAAITAFVLTTLAIVYSFTALFVPERNVVFSLACLLFCVKRFEEGRSAAWAVAAVVCAQIMVNYKETAFLLLVGFALGRLVLRCENPARAGWNIARLRDRESRLDWCLAFLGVIFFLYYLAVMYPRWGMQYASKMQIPRIEVFLAYLKVDLLAWLLIAVVLGRVYLILRQKVRPWPFWDGLALGGAAYFVAYLYLGLFAQYYSAPVDAVATIYICRVAILSMRKMRAWGKVATLALLFACLFQGISLSGVYLYQRKNVIHAKAEAAQVIEARYWSREGAAPRLFFPSACPFAIMGFASYLNYQGIPIEGLPVEPAGLRPVSLVGRAVTADGPCVEYRSLICRASGDNGPERGDLVVVLPDDEASFADIAPYRTHGELLFSYAPHPRMPQWLYPIVNCFRIASPRAPAASIPMIWHRRLPDRWLDASVAAWR